jgi:hypothetical protein
MKTVKNGVITHLIQLMRGEVGCKEEQSRWLSIAALPEDIASGEVHSRQEESGKWTKAAPSSIDGKTLRVVYDGSPKNGSVLNSA